MNHRTNAKALLVALLLTASALVTPTANAAAPNRKTPTPPHNPVAVAVSDPTTGVITKFELDWEAPTFTTESIADYAIRTSTDGGYTWQNYPDSVSATTSLTTGTPQTGHEYLFQVRALTYTGVPSEWVTFANGTDSQNPGTSFIQVDTGIGFACALATNGTISCWGRNVEGELGRGTFSNGEGPGLVSGVTDAIQISVDSYNACYLSSAGIVKCWGYGGGNRLGNRSEENSAVPVGVADVEGAMQVSTGYAGSCALIYGGTVKCWGEALTLGAGNFSTNGQTVTVAGLSDATSISTGLYHSCATVLFGSLKCWGYNANGQLGIGNTNNMHTATTVPGLDYVFDVVAIDETTCALNLATVFCWGKNDYNQIRGGAQQNYSSPRAIYDAEDVKSLPGSYWGNCFIDKFEELKCWGSNLNGRLGGGTIEATDNVVSPIGLDAVLDMEGATTFTCALQVDSAIKCWGESSFVLGDSSPSSTPIQVFDFGSQAIYAPAAKTAPNAPSTGSIMSLGGRDYLVTWDAPSSNGSEILDYDVDISTDGGMNYTNLATTTTPTVTLYDQNPGLNVTLKIVARNEVGNSSPGYLGFTTDAELPSQIQNLNATYNASTSSATLTWSQPELNGGELYSYVIEKRLNGGVWQEAIRTVFLTVAIDELVVGGNYDFRVSAFTSVGTGLASATANVRVPAGAPGQVAGIKSVSAKGKNKITWSPAAANGSAITKYELRWKSSTNKKWSKWISAGRKTSATVSGWAKGKKYQVQVRATSAAGSSLSSIVAITQKK